MDEISQSIIKSEHFLSEKDDLRCPICYLIPLILNIDFSPKEPIITIQCQNNHLITKKLKILYNDSKNYQINSIKCNNCNEMNLSNLLYCIKCYKFICKKEKNTHSHNGEHKLIPINKIDYGCWNEEHNFCNVTTFCYTHNKNICIFCKEEHKNDKIEDFKIIKKREFQELKDKITKMRRFINKLTERVNKFVDELEKFKNDIIKSFQLFKENFELQFFLIQDLFNCYEFKKENNHLNYQIINNLKNIKINDYEKNYNINIFQIPNKDNILNYFKQKQFVGIKDFDQTFLNNSMDEYVNITEQSFNSSDFEGHDNFNNNNLKNMNICDNRNKDFIEENNEEIIDDIRNFNFRKENDELRIDDNRKNGFRLEKDNKRIDENRSYHFIIKSSNNCDSNLRKNYENIIENNQKTMLEIM